MVSLSVKTSQHFSMTTPNKEDRQSGNLSWGPCFHGGSTYRLEFEGIPQYGGGTHRICNNGDPHHPTTNHGLLLTKMKQNVAEFVLRHTSNQIKYHECRLIPAGPMTPVNEGFQPPLPTSDAHMRHGLSISQQEFIRGI